MSLLGSHFLQPRPRRAKKHHSRFVNHRDDVMQLSQFDYLRRAVEALFSGAALALQAQHDGRGHWGDMEEVEGDDREYGSTLLVSYSIIMYYTCMLRVMDSGFKM